MPEFEMGAEWPGLNEAPQAIEAAHVLSALRQANLEAGRGAMDLQAARRWVVDDMREVEPSRWEGRSDEEVLDSVASDGIDLDEVELRNVPQGLIHAYEMVLEAQ